MSEESKPAGKATIGVAVVESMQWLPEAIENAAKKTGFEKSEFIRRVLAEACSKHNEEARELYASWLRIFDPNAKPLCE